MRVEYIIKCHGMLGNRVEEIIMENFTKAVTYPALGLGILTIGRTYHVEGVTFYVRIHGVPDVNVTRTIMEHLRIAATYKSIGWGVDKITTKYYHDWSNCPGHANMVAFTEFQT
jgi:hypothetical protein